MPKIIVWFTLLCILPVLMHAAAGADSDIKTRSTLSQDGVKIVYKSGGNGEITLLFIHGGYADKSYWRNQLTHFALKHRVIAVDLAAHGQSGKNRDVFSMKAFALDVLAVMEKEKVNRAILIGNSLGGPTALEAAILLPGEVLGIVGVDTFNDIQAKRPAGFFKKLIQSVRSDFEGTMTGMAKSVLRDGERNPLYGELHKKMLTFPRDDVVKVLEYLEEYDLLETIKKVPHPIRCINGDTYATYVEKNRRVHADFNAVILPKTGHYPMLERPEKFNHLLETVISQLISVKKSKGK
ncbi:MAG: alpha/beta hydrolase [bacterium]|nr:alpha/beta hydrolase [bacterium]